MGSWTVAVHGLQHGSAGCMHGQPAGIELRTEVEHGRLHDCAGAHGQQAKLN